MSAPAGKPMSPPIGEPNTIAKVAEVTGVPAHQIKYAITRGELRPKGPKVGKAYTLTDDQVELIKSARDLVVLGAGLWLAMRLIQNGWIQSAQDGTVK